MVCVVGVFVLVLEWVVYKEFVIVGFDCEMVWVLDLFVFVLDLLFYVLVMMIVVILV